jgi:superfamily II DNA or RNA helicase
MRDQGAGGSAILTLGQSVRLRNDPNRWGILEAIVDRNGRPYGRVRAAGALSTFPLRELEAVPEQTETPIERLRQGTLDGPDRLRRRLAHVRLSGRLSDMVYSLEATNTEFHAHQFKPVLKMLASPNDALLIADEVGLGKTIEAGLIWTELRARLDLRRLLVACPKVLCEKWREELRGKFDLDAQIMKPDELLERLMSTAEMERGFVAICSLQGLRPPKDWDDPEGDGAQRGSARLARFLAERIGEEPVFDLAIFDEAHHLRNPETRTNDAARRIRDAAQHVVFLSATPIQLRNRDLFSLLTLVDHETFRDERSLEDIIVANAGLIRAREAALRDGAAEDVAAAIRAAKAHPLLAGSRQLDLILSRIEAHAEDWSLAARAEIAARLEQANLLANVVNRTRRRDVQELRVTRRVDVFRASMTPAEREVYDAVTREVAEYAEHTLMPPAFLMTGPQRLLASSIPAALAHWRAAGGAAGYEDEEVDENGELIGEPAAALGPLVGRLRTLALRLPHPDELARIDTKYAELRSVLRDAFDKRPDGKIILFSTFRATLDYLARRLEAEGVATVQLHGGTDGRADVIAGFAASRTAHVLLSSEVGSEGVDLQFARVVINYDLPWNPMRIEQRIGRVDRMGQKADSISVLNLMHADTIDDRIYDRLYRRLRICEEALGGFEEVLGRQIAELTPDLLLGRLSEEEIERRLQQTAQAAETRRREEEALEREAGALLAHGDRILTAINDAKDKQRWVSAAELADYLGDGLATLAAGNRLTLRDDDPGLFDLRLTPETKAAYGAWLDRQRVREGRRILRDDVTRCRLGKPGASSQIEHLTQAHPLVRFVAHELERHESMAMKPASAIRVRGEIDGISPGRYVLAAEFFRFSGAVVQETVAYAAARLDGLGALLPPEAAEALARAAATRGVHWIEAQAVIDLDAAAERASRLFEEVLATQFEEIERQREAEVEDRVAIQLQTLEMRTAERRSAIERRIDEAGRGGTSPIIRLYEGQLRKLEEKTAQRRVALENGRRLTPEQEMLGLAVIEVTP